jgi:hypothetical protein
MLLVREAEDTLDQVLLDEPAADILFLVRVGVAGAARNFNPFQLFSAEGFAQYGQTPLCIIPRRIDAKHYFGTSESGIPSALATPLP